MLGRVLVIFTRIFGSLCKARVCGDLPFFGAHGSARNQTRSPAGLADPSPRQGGIPHAHGSALGDPAPRRHCSLVGHVPRSKRRRFLRPRGVLAPRFRRCAELHVSDAAASTHGQYPATRAAGAVSRDLASGAYAQDGAATSIPGQRGAGQQRRSQTDDSRSIARHSSTIHDAAGFADSRSARPNGARRCPIGCVS